MDKLSKAYEPDKFEKAIYQWWEDKELFAPETQIKYGLKPMNKVEGRYCLTLPPPNVTGSLHLGHAITISLEDLMIRYARMNGKETLYLPGSDHAGIATQNVVERELLKQGIKRKELGREKFIEEVWKWKEKYHKRITEQSKRLGMSCDWSRERFTLDENLSKSVRKAFVILFKKHLIYRGDYLINWCPGRCESAISDLEAIPEEENGQLWYIRYPVVDSVWKGPVGEWGSGTWAKGARKYITVATTRPETLLGDSAVATKKEHEKYGKMIGKTVALPVVGRKIPVIQDEYVDISFGTGALKITPAHDPNDYEIGKRHNLDQISILDSKANLIEEYSGKYAGMDRFKARKAIVKDLEVENLLEKIEPYRSAIPRCERCHTIIEPKISTQWFVKTKPLAENAIAEVKSGNTVIIPEREKNRFYHWMENIKDWCISRQLWWGHRIPIWYCPENHQTCEEEDPEQCSTCGSTELVQDEDVLDTWFSSGLWPFSTLGWGWDDGGKDLQRYFPTDMRETGYDILFFWVAREMMLATELTGKTPYKTVYLHGIVRNEHGKKISKSMENIEEYDPLNIIAKDGADALRFTLVTNSTPGLDLNLDLKRVESARKFCNKIWQSTKYILANLDSDVQYNSVSTIDFSKFELVDLWILSKLQNVIQNVTNYMESFSYLEAGREIYTFYWNIFCDYYLEFSKIRMYDEKKDNIIPTAVLLHILLVSFKLLHPIMPFITEKLFQTLPSSVKGSEGLIITLWPKKDVKFLDEVLEKEFDLIISIINVVRSIRGEYRIPHSKNVSVIVISKNSAKFNLIKSNLDEICSLAKISKNKIKLVKTSKKIPHSEEVNVSDVKIIIPLTGLVDFEKEISRITKDIGKLTKILQQTENKLQNEKFLENASKKVVETERTRHSETTNKIQQLKTQLGIFK